MRRIYVVISKAGYKNWYTAHGPVADWKHIPFPIEKSTSHGPKLLAIVPESCKDYDDLEGMELEEALVHLRENSEEYIKRFGGNESMARAIYNGLVRLIEGTWDEDGYWIARGLMPNQDEEAVDIA